MLESEFCGTEVLGEYRSIETWGLIASRSLTAMPDEREKGRGAKDDGSTEGVMGLFNRDILVHQTEDS